MAALSSDWLRHFRLLLWNRWTEFNETWQEARSQRPLPSLCLFGPIGKTRWVPLPLIGWDIFDFSSETAEQNSSKLDRKQGLNVLYQVCVFRADWKNKMAPWPLIGWDIFDFSSETTERNSTKLERKQDLNVFYQVCIFFGQSEKQDGRPGLWLAETFSTSSLKPQNRIHWNYTVSKISTPSTKFVFFVLIGKTRCRPCVWLAETFSTSHLKLRNGIQRNLTRSKISRSSTKFVFFLAIGKTRWSPWLLIGWDIFDSSSETPEWILMQLDRKQDLNLLYQVCVFRADQ